MASSRVTTPTPGRLNAVSRKRGADRARTDDLLHAMQTLFQLSYGPYYVPPCSEG